MVVVAEDQQGLAEIRNRDSLLDRFLLRDVLRLPLAIIVSAARHIWRWNLRLRKDCRRKNWTRSWFGPQVARFTLRRVAGRSPGTTEFASPALDSRLDNNALTDNALVGSKVHRVA